MMQKFWLVWFPGRDGIKMEGYNNKDAIQASSSWQNYHSHQLVVMPNEIVGLYCRDYPPNDPPQFCLVCAQYKDLPSESSLLGASIFLVKGCSYLSAWKILALGASTTMVKVFLTKRSFLLLLILLLVFQGDVGLPGKMGSRGDTGNDVSVQKNCFFHI